MSTTGRRQLHRSIPRVVVLLTLGLAFLALTGPAAAASCAKRVIDDWYADGRVDGEYALSCYDDAIEALPGDVRIYSSAEEDIQRALQAALRGDDPPPSTTDPDGNPGTGGPSDPRDPPREDPDPGPRRGDTPGLAPGDGDGGPEVIETEDVTPASDSIPLPLLVLAGLALLLIAAGSLGYLVRRLQARRIPPASL